MLAISIQLSHPKAAYSFWKLEGLIVSKYRKKHYSTLKAHFQSMYFSERAEILLFAVENVTLKLKIVTAEQLLIV